MVGLVELCLYFLFITIKRKNKNNINYYIRYRAWGQFGPKGPNRLGIGHAAAATLLSALAANKPAQLTSSKSWYWVAVRGCAWIGRKTDLRVVAGI